MAASSPALANHRTDTTNSTAAKVTILTSAANPTHRPDTAPKTQRGLNKPKCIQCGNVARSRCPFASCKSCCARNQNPCPIHVLKANAAFPDKSPTASTPATDQQGTEASPSMNSSRFSPLRQLSSNFAQFNNLNTPLRSRKPLNRKEAAAINEWRFSKLKEYRERNMEAENEAFDRYMQNIGLLEEVFSVKPTLEGDMSSVSESSTSMPLKLLLRSSSFRNDSVRRRVQQIVDQGIKQLQKYELSDSVDEPVNQKEPNKTSKRARIWSERASAITDLIDKLNKARNEDDLNSCLDMKSQLYKEDKSSTHTESEDVALQKNPASQSNLAPGKDWYYCLPKPVGTSKIDQEILITIDKHFSSLEHIEEL